MKRFLLLLLFLPCVSHSATWYVDNSCGTNGNGSSTTCGRSGPWNSLANVTCSGMSPGDHLQIRKGVYRESQGGGAVSWNVPSACSGSSAGAGTTSTPIYIENYPGENVVIDGSIDIHTSTWTSVGGGVYRCSGTCKPAQASSGWAWIAWWVPAAGGAEQEIYAYQSSACDSTIPAGFMAVNGAGAAPCVHLPDGSSPANATSFSIPNITYLVSVPGSGTGHDIYLRRNPSGGSFVLRRSYYDIISSSFSSLYNFTVDGLDIGYALNRCVDIDNANYPPATTFTTHPQNDTFTHNHIHHCGQEAIHYGADTLTMTFTYNEFDHIQIPPWFQHCGTTGSVPGGSTSCGPNFTDRGVAIRAWCMVATSCYFGGNIFHDSGGGHQWGRFSAIHLEYGAINTVVENNLIYNMGPLGTHQFNTGTGGNAFQLDGWSPSYPTCNPCTFRNNRVYNTDNVFQFEGTDASPSTINVYNNTFVNFSDSAIAVEGADSGTVSATLNLVNNIFYWSPTANNSTSGPTNVMLGSVAGGGTFRITGAFSNNSFYCTTGCSGAIIDWPTGTTYTSSTINGSNGNIWRNPEISLTATGLPYDLSGSGSTYAPWNAYKLPVPAMYITTTSGSAYQLGKVLSPTFPDSLGTARPTGGAWDLGALQYQTLPTMSAPTGLQLQ